MQEGYIDAVGGHQHWPQTGDSESVGGAVADIQNLRKRKGLIGGWGGVGGKEGRMVAPGSDKYTV